MNRLQQRVSLAAALLMMLSGCATTESLYAQYDELCPVSVAVTSVGMVTVTGVATVDGSARTDLWQPTVYFGFDQHALDDENRTRLASNLAVLELYPSLQISVQAFTDQAGEPAYNRRLAEQRQRAVVNFLVEHGISRSRLKASAPAMEAPLKSSTTVEDRIVNRRVELMPLDAQGRPLVLRVDFEQSGSDGFVAPSPVR